MIVGKPADIRLVKRTWTDLRRFIMAFVDSDYDCIEVTKYSHKDAKSCHASLHNAIKYTGQKGLVEVHLIKGKIYLTKTIALQNA